MKAKRKLRKLERQLKKVRRRIRDLDSDICHLQSHLLCGTPLIRPDEEGWELTFENQAGAKAYGSQGPRSA